MSKEHPHQTLARLVGFGPRVPKAELPDEGEPPRTDEGALFETGEELIQSIFGAISLRRPVLVTGPRGCGKTYCAEEAIRRAEAAGLIRGNHFRLGNREDSRSDFQEDSPSFGLDPETKRAGIRTNDALLVSWPKVVGGMQKQRDDVFSNPEGHYGQILKNLKNDEEKSVLRNHFPGSPRPIDWQPKDWVVLFLDEINRFGDGVLDSFLSLTEERRIVRAGVELYVPVVVVATANPPGYDATAKKLSPPLQARMARMYRVSQPSVETVASAILPAQIERYRLSFEKRIQGELRNEKLKLELEIGLRLRRKVALAGLCLWGWPDQSRKGVGFLTRDSRILIKRVCKADPTLDKLVKRLGALTSFGPDARAIGDWVGHAIEVAVFPVESPADGVVRCKLKERHLFGKAALVTIAGKPRDNFNEGTEPAKAAEREGLVRAIVERVLASPLLDAFIDNDPSAAVAPLTGLPSELLTDDSVTLEALLADKLPPKASLALRDLSKALRDANARDVALAKAMFESVRAACLACARVVVREGATNPSSNFLRCVGSAAAPASGSASAPTSGTPVSSTGSAAHAATGIEAHAAAAALLWSTPHVRRFDLVDGLRDEIDSAARAFLHERREKLALLTAASTHVADLRKSLESATPDIDAAIKETGLQHYPLTRETLATELLGKNGALIAEVLSLADAALSAALSHTSGIRIPVAVRLVSRVSPLLGVTVSRLHHAVKRGLDGEPHARSRAAKPSASTAGGKLPPPVPAARGDETAPAVADLSSSPPGAAPSEGQTEAAKLDAIAANSAQSMGQPAAVDTVLLKVAAAIRRETSFELAEEFARELGPLPRSAAPAA